MNSFGILGLALAARCRFLRSRPGFVDPHVLIVDTCARMICIPRSWFALRKIGLAKPTEEYLLASASPART